MPQVNRPPLVRQLFAAFFSLSLLSLVLLVWFAAQSSRDLIYTQTRTELEERARLVQNQLRQEQQRDSLLLNNTTHADAWLKELVHGHSMRITLIRPDGTVLGDTHEEPGRMDNHAARPEIAAALQGSMGSSRRHSATLETRLLYVALPPEAPGMNVVLRTSMPVSAIAHEVRLIQGRLLSGGLAALLISALFGFWAARRISRPLEAMRSSADRIAAGDLDHRLPGNYRSFELFTLANSINHMASKLAEQIRRLDREKQQRQALLEGMDEGVLALDQQGRILSCNPSAQEMLQLGHHPHGALIGDLLDEHPILQYLDRAKHEALRAELALDDEGSRILRLQAGPLPEIDRHGRILLAVFNDVTQIHQAEQQRREFVSNVSHELRTPVTSIRGYVETMLDGAMGDEETAQRFLEIIRRQSIRLNSIIEDLLALARIERQQEHDLIQLDSVDLNQLLDDVLEDHEMLAQKAQIVLKRDTQSCCGHDSTCSAMLDRPLFERALVNLLINAIRYSECGTQVLLRACTEQRMERDGFRLEVIDQGCGIPEEHLPRLFERFYVVDKARSRQLGGTGLGLSIVKHVALLHGGDVGVESQSGKGSRFWIWVPA